VRLVSLLLQRKVFKILGHVNFKSKIDRLHYPSKWGEEFCSSVLLKERSTIVQKTIIEMSDTVIIVLTAAPSCYAKHIRDVFFLSDRVQVISSRVIDKYKYLNNFSVQKVYELKKLTINSDSLVLFTDHLDDIPLAEYCTSVYLCNPTRNNLEWFESKNLSFHLLEDE